jgi:hypothetical protein
MGSSGRNRLARWALLCGAWALVMMGGPPAAVAQAAAPGMIGVGTTDAPGNAGALVGIVTPDSPGARAGVQVGDLITSVNGAAVANATALVTTIRALRPGQTARLAVLRESGSGAKPLTVAVIVSVAATPGGEASAPATGVAAPPNLPAHPLTVSGYTRFTDPLERAFTLEVPAGWQSVGGLARRSALQINAFVRSMSPDKMTYILIGEPTLPSFVPPTPMRNSIGYREGKWFNSGLGGLSLVLHFMPGTEFARLYGQSALSGLCPGLKFAGSRERPDMTQNADKLVPAVAPSVSQGGEARFSCQHNEQPMEARIEAVTRATRDNIMWNVIFLKGFLAPASQADKAQEILDHMGATFAFDQAWMQKQSHLDEQAALAINRNMQEFFRQQQGVIRNLNSMDENFSAVDEIVSGYSTDHDAATGTDYKLSNTDPYKWKDNSSGRIFSTATDAPPAWGGNLTQLVHVAQ